MGAVSHKITEMKILTLKNEEELANQTEVIFRELAEKNKRRLRGFLPTGRSVEEFYKLLRQNIAYWNDKFQVLQIDEFVGTKRFFYSKLCSELIVPLGLENHQDPIDPSWSDEEMSQHIQTVLSTPIDFALLGLGPNGHIGFHEPKEIQADNLEVFFGGRVYLSDQSFKRVKGAPSQWALTFGAASFLKAKKIILIASGNDKEEIFQQFLNSAPTNKIPATLLKNHSDFTVLTTFKA